MAGPTTRKTQEQCDVVEALLDTATVVDLLSEAATDWISKSNEAFGVTKFIWMEIVKGSDSKQSLIQATKLLARFALIPVTVDDIDWTPGQSLQNNYGFYKRF